MKKKSKIYELKIINEKVKRVFLYFLMHSKYVDFISAILTLFTYFQADMI